MYSGKAIKIRNKKKMNSIGNRYSDKLIVAQLDKNFTAFAEYECPLRFPGQSLLDLILNHVSPVHGLVSLLCLT
jgi:hypothetical protein